MSKILCLGEVALHNWTEYLVKEKYIAQYSKGCGGGFDVTTTYNFDSRHRIYDKNYLLFCMVLFDKLITTSPSLFIYDKVVETGIIDERFFYRDYLGRDNKLVNESGSYYSDVAVNFIRSNKKSLINYLSKDILHTNRFSATIDPQLDFESYLEDPHHHGVQRKFNPNVFILIQIRDSMEKGLILSQKKDVIFYNGRLSYRNKSHELLFNSNKFSDYTNYILQLDLSPEISQFPMPQNMMDVLFLRRQPAIKSFREVFFHWVDCIANGELNIAAKIKKDVISANNALEKYRDFERKKTNLFYCTIDAIAGQIPYLSTFLGAVSPYSLRKTLKSKNENSWVTLLK